MHILFIGGTGLISSFIARQLVTEGHRVTLFNRGKSENRVGDSPLVDEIIGDRKDYAAFEATFADKSYDVVVDMVAFSPDDTASAVRAFRGRCKQFIHCSTVCVYSGPPQQIPTTENEPFHSIGGYGKNKIAIEEMLFAESAKGDFPMTILRPSHSYGEGGTLIRPWAGGATLVDRLQKGLPVVVPGDGTGLWASCHCEDVARGFVATMLNEKCYGEAYNITADEWMTWNTYFEQIAEVVGGTFDPVYIPTSVLGTVAPKYSGGLKEIFAWPSIFDNSKIKRDTDYDGQTVSFKEGARRTLAWADANGKLETVKDGEYEDVLIGAWRGVAGSLPVQA